MRIRRLAALTLPGPSALSAMSRAARRIRQLLTLDRLRAAAVGSVPRTTARIRKLLSGRSNPRTTGRRLLALVVVVLAVLAGGYAGLVSIRSHSPVSVAPSGPYAVGRITRQWVDDTRIDPFAPLGGRRRTLSVWVWYPATPGTWARPAPYAPHHWRQLHRFGIAETDFDKIETGTLDNPKIAAGRFPLVVLMPGLGFAAPQYASIAATLAARGYVVAGVTPTYSANLTVLDGRPFTATVAGNPGDNLSGGRADLLLATWSADAQFAAKQVPTMFTDHIDKTTVVYVGHSFGGAVAVDACHADDNCVGAADLDGTPYGPVVTTGSTKPLLLLSGDDGGAVTDPATWEAFAASDGPRLAYTIAGARHFDFTDYAAYYLAAPVRRSLPLGEDGPQVLTITSAYLGAFADRVAKRAAWTAPTYPRVQAADLPTG